MKRYPPLYIWLFALFAICTACDRRTPSNVLSRKEMTQVLADYHLARAMISNLDNDQRYKGPLILNGVFEKHGITKAVFDSSMVWYTRNPQDLAIIYGRVNQVLQERISSESQRGVEFGERKQLLTFSDPYPAGDSIDLWRNAPFLEMNRLLSSRKEQFIISPDTTFRPTDLIEWKLNAYFLPQSNRGGKALMYLMVRYASDSVVISSRVIQKNGRYSLTVRNNSGLEMRQIWGFVHYFPGNNPKDWQNRLFLDRIQLMRYRNTARKNKSAPDSIPDPETAALLSPTDSAAAVTPATPDSVSPDNPTEPLPAQPLPSQSPEELPIEPIGSHSEQDQRPQIRVRRKSAPTP